MSHLKENKDVSPQLKAHKRAERLLLGIPPNTMLEVHHIIPRYAGGSNDEENLTALTRAEHLLAHFIATHDPPPGQNTWAEWAASRHIFGRISIDEFTDFLSMIEPMIPQLRQTLEEKREKRVKKLP